MDRDARAASFGPTAAAYARSRPNYPEAAVDWLVPAGAARVLDLGAGTGKLTEALVARGLDVVAVDPSGAMLAELRRACPDAETLEGRAEAIPLPDGSVDAVVVAQAWHWFDPGRAAAEIARVLRPGGRLGLVWNTRDKSVEWVTRFERIVDCGDTPAYDAVPIVPPPLRGDETVTFHWELPFDEAALLDLTTSRSAFLVLPEPARDTMLEGVRQLFDEIASASHGDPHRRFVAMPYVTRGFRYTLG